MNILVVGLFMNDSFGLHIFETLAQMGHNTSKFSVEPNTYIYKGKVDYFFKKAVRKIHNILNEFSFYRNFFFKKLYLNINDIDLVIVTHDFLLPDQIDKIRLINPRIKIVLWFPDAISMIGKQYFLVSDYDILFFKDKFIVEKINTYTSLKAYYLPECFNPSYIVESDNLVQDIDVSIIGNFHSWRVAALDILKNFNIVFYGVNSPLWLNNSWMNFIKRNKPVYNYEKSKIILRSKININNLHLAEINGGNARLFEICGSGGFLICSYSEAIEEMYKDGCEIVMYKNKFELYDKVSFYLNNPIERFEIARNAKIRSINEHTYEHRLSKLLKICDLI